MNEYLDEWPNVGSQVWPLCSDVLSVMPPTFYLATSVGRTGLVTEEDHFAHIFGNAGSKIVIPVSPQNMPCDPYDFGLIRKFNSSSTSMVPASCRSASLEMDSRQNSMESDSQGIKGCVWKTMCQPSLGDSVSQNSFMNNLFNYSSFNISIKENYL